MADADTVVEGDSVREGVPVGLAEAVVEADVLGLMVREELEVVLLLYVGEDDGLAVTDGVQLGEKVSVLVEVMVWLYELLGLDDGV